jgi:L-idonate 5-dehydrogenase
MVLIRNRRVGICGSDLHYFAHGKCAAFIPDRPFALGHELSGEIAQLGDGVTGWPLGQRVTVNPARSCGFCRDCKRGRPNLCPNIIMLGSASTTPPTNGALAEYTLVRADQLHALPDGMDDSLAAMLEPFAVGLHAVKRAGTVSGKTVLVTGGGTIGLLTALAARAYGATLVVVSDPVKSRRIKATEWCADAVMDPVSAESVNAALDLTAGGFDVIFEASGAPPALRQAFDLVRRGGTLVQIGTLGTDDVPLPANAVMNREITFLGSMRYGDVFDDAIRLVSSGRVDLSPALTGVFPFPESTAAFVAAGDKVHALKVQIEL